MFDAFYSIPSWLRASVALLVLGTGLFLTIQGFRARKDPALVRPEDARANAEQREAATSFRLGMGLSLVGCVLFVLSGSSDAERNGYKW